MPSEKRPIFAGELFRRNLRQTPCAHPKLLVAWDGRLTAKATQRYKPGFVQSHIDPSEHYVRALARGQRDKESKVLHDQ